MQAELSQKLRIFIQNAELAGNDDLLSKELRQREHTLHMLYLRSVCDSQAILSDVVKPFTEKRELDDYVRYVEALPDTNIVTGYRDDDWTRLLYEGHLLLFGPTHVWSIMVRSYEAGSIGDAKVETVVQGPQDSFSSDLDVNLNLLRNRYRNPSLRIKKRGTETHAGTRIAVLYDEELVNQAVLEELERKLDQVRGGVVQSAGHLQRLLFVRSRWMLFPTMMITERPDRTVLNLSSGKVVLFIEGENFALMAPCVFMDFFSSMDDIGMNKPVSFFLNLIRSLSLFIAVCLPAFYVAVSSFNPELFRIQLALVVAGTRASVPYPPYLEVLFMLLMMETLNEASVRLPKTIGPAATTVGGLILGQAATSAGLVGNIMIIIVAAVAICNFTVPVTVMSFTVRILKYSLILMASLFGLNGILVGLLGLLMYLVQLESFGEPYFRLFQTKKKA
jgi:hypothetical protein